MILRWGKGVAGMAWVWRDGKSGWDGGGWMASSMGDVSGDERLFSANSREGSRYNSGFGTAAGDAVLSEIR